MAHKEADFFLESLSMLLRSSLPVREAISTLKDEIKSKKMLKAITIIENEIDSGSKISIALQKSGLLQERFVSLLKLGEETGELQKQFGLVIQEQKKEQALHGKIRGALMYPGIVLIIALIVGIFAMWYIFPRITTVFISAGGDLPITTKAIIAIGDFFTSYGVIVVPIAAVTLGSLIYVLFIQKKTKHIGESMLIHIGPARTIIMDIELSRFGYIMGSMLHAGISIPQSLISIRDSTGFMLYKQFYESVYQQVTEGNSLYKSISNYPNYQLFIPSYLARLLSAGEKSGSLPDTLIDIGAMFETKTDNLAQNVSVLLEPIILVFVGIMVAFLAIGIIAPIYGLTSQIK